MDYLRIELVLQSVTSPEQWGSKSLTQNQYHIVACWFNKSGNQIGVRVDGTNHLHQLMIMITHYKQTKN